MLDGHLIYLVLMLVAMPMVADRVLLRLRVVSRDDLAFRCVGSYVLSVAWVVGSAWNLHLVSWLTPEAWRTTTLVVLVAAAAVLNPKELVSCNLWGDLWRGATKIEPDVRWVIGIAGIWWGVGLLRIYLLPSTNPDSLTQHLPMAATWLQQGDLSEFPAYRLLMHVRPIHAHLQTMFLLSFLPDNSLIELAQWIAWTATFAATYALARVLEISRSFSAAAALLAVSTPAALAFSTTNQIDMPGMAMGACFLSYLARCLRGGGFASYAMAGASFGLYFGTRSQALLLIPGVALVLAGWLICDRESSRRKILRSLAFGLPLLLLGLPRYVQNFLRYGSFFDLSDAEIHATLGWENLSRHLWAIWPNNFLDRPWSPIGIVNWQQNTAHLGWPLTYLALPIALGSLMAVVGMPWRERFRTPAPFLVLVANLVLAVGLVWNPPVPVREMRYLVLISVPLFVAAAWCLERWSRGRVGTLRPTVLFFVAFLNGAAWLTGSSLRRMLAALISMVVLGGVALWLRRGAPRSTLRMLGVAAACLVAVTHFALSVLQDHRSSLALMLMMAQTQPADRTEARVASRLAGRIAGQELEGLVEASVPPDALLVVSNVSRSVADYYALFGDQHRRRVRLLVDYESHEQDDSRIRHGLSSLRKQMELAISSRSLWLLRPRDGAWEIPVLLEEQGCDRAAVSEGWETWNCSQARS